MPVNLTITGKTGPGNTLTAVSYNGITLLQLFPDQKTIQFLGSDGIMRAVDVTGNTGMTVTCTSTSTTYTITVVGT